MTTSRLRCLLVAAIVCAVATSLACASPPPRTPSPSPPDDSPETGTTSLQPGTSDTIDLPGDTAVAIKLHPERLADMLDGAPAPPTRSDDLPTPEALTRSLVYQGIPRWFVANDTSSSQMIGEAVRDAILEVLRKNSPHRLDALDTSRYVVIALWTGEQRAALRRLRRLGRRWNDPPSDLSDNLRATIYYPTDAPERLRKEIERSCRRPEDREEDSDRPAPVPDLCGRIDAWNATETRLAVHARYNGPLGRPPRDERTPDLDRGSPLPKTPARRVFTRSTGAVSIYATATGLAHVGTIQARHGWGMPQYAPLGAHLEYEDATLSVRSHDVDGLAIELYRSRTTLGAEILERADAQRSLPDLAVSDPVFELERNWHTRRAADAAERPFWMQAEHNEHGEIELHPFTESASYLWGVQTALAHPSAFNGLVGETETPFSDLRRYAPNTLRLRLGRAAEQESSDDTSPTPVGGLVAEFPRSVANRLASRLSSELEPVEAALETEIDSRWTVHGDQVRLSLRPSDRSWEETFASTSSAADVGRLTADPTGLGDLLSGTETQEGRLGTLLSTIERVDIDTRETADGSAMRVHLGGGDLPAPRLPDLDWRPLQPSSPPPCHGRVLHALRQSSDPKTVLDQIEPEIANCDVSGVARRDLRIAHRTVLAGAARAAMQSGKLQQARRHFEKACRLGDADSCPFASHLSSFESPELPVAHTSFEMLNSTGTGHLLTPAGLFPVEGPHRGRRELSKDVVDRWRRPFDRSEFGDIAQSSETRFPPETRRFAPDVAIPSDLGVGVVARAARYGPRVIRFTVETSNTMPGERGLVLLDPRNDIAPSDRVDITPAGFELVDDGQPLEPVDGCDDATICTRPGDVPVATLVDRYQTALADDETDRARELAADLANRYDWSALHEKLVAWHRRDDLGPKVAFRADPRLPVDLPVRAIGENLYRLERPTDGGAPPAVSARVGGELVPRPTLGVTKPDGPDLSRARGRSLYGRHCSRCHGSSGGGSQHGPSILESPRIDRPADLHQLVEAGPGARVHQRPKQSDNAGDEPNVRWVRSVRRPAARAMLVNYVHMHLGDGTRERSVEWFSEQNESTE